jgi:hypothetical protein
LQPGVGNKQKFLISQGGIKRIDVHKPHNLLLILDALQKYHCMGFLSDDDDGDAGNGKNNILLLPHTHTHIYS